MAPSRRRPDLRSRLGRRARTAAPPALGFGCSADQQGPPPAVLRDGAPEASVCPRHQLLRLEGQEAAIVASARQDGLDHLGGRLQEQRLADISVDGGSPVDLYPELLDGSTKNEASLSAKHHRRRAVQQAREGLVGRSWQMPLAEEGTTVRAAGPRLVRPVEQLRNLQVTSDIGSIVERAEQGERAGPLQVEPARQGEELRSADHGLPCKQYYGPRSLHEDVTAKRLEALRRERDRDRGECTSGAPRRVVTPPDIG